MENKRTEDFLCIMMSFCSSTVDWFDSNYHRMGDFKKVKIEEEMLYFYNKFFFPEIKIFCLNPEYAQGYKEDLLLLFREHNIDMKISIFNLDDYDKISRNARRQKIEQTIARAKAEKEVNQ